MPTMTHINKAHRTEDHESYLLERQAQLHRCSCHKYLHELFNACISPKIKREPWKINGYASKNRSFLILTVVIESNQFHLQNIAYARETYMQVNETMASNAIIFSGLINVTVIICLAPFFSSSMGAKTLVFPVSFRIRRARCRRISGPYVSGRNRRPSKDAPAIISPTQNVHLQPIGETKPDMIGANCGPQVVAYGIA